MAKNRIVKGERQDSFDLATAPAVVPEGATIFIAPEASELLILFKGKDEKKSVINGEVVTVPATTVQFHNFMFVCKDPEIEKLLRDSDSFKAGRVKDLSEMVEANLNREAKNIVDKLKSNEVIAAKVMASLKRAATQAPTIEQSK
mgnify:CR=1 FL=1